MQKKSFFVVWDARIAEFTYQCVYSHWLVLMKCDRFGIFFINNVHGSFAVVSHNNLSLTIGCVTQMTNGVRKSVTINFQIFMRLTALVPYILLMYDTSLNQKSNSNSNAKIATLKHSSKELERYRISIVFGYSCIAKIISNAHLIRSVQLNFNKNRKLINQIFKCGFMICFSRCFFFSCCLV